MFQGRTLRPLLVLLVFLATGSSAESVDAQQPVPSPAEVLGFTPGEHRKLATWDELVRYYGALADGSPRVRVDTLGRSTRDRPFLLLTITSPDNLDRLEELRQVQERLADPRTIGDENELEDLLDRGKAVALVTHAIHSTEVGSALSGVRLAHRLASSDDPRVLEILDDVIVLHVPSLNPDGTEWVARWYREWVGTEYEGAPLPWLYHHYTGHDANRDWYALTQDETRLTVSGVHNRWHPQIVHDIHQMSRDGPRIFFPPYVDPWEPNVDPALTAAVNQLGLYAAADLTARGRSGVVNSAIYDAFTPARAYQHYHAGARILSETASALLATPVRVEWEELEPRRGFDPHARTWNHPVPWEGGEWGLPDIVAHMEEGALALLTHAARNRRFWLENFHRIGRRAVEGWEGWPDAWVVPAGQSNRTGTEYLLRVLVEGGVEVERAPRAFRAAGRRFPAGSWLIRMRQPYAAFAQTLLESQEYPELREYPGGPPQRPYDVTAHTLPLLLGVEAVPVDGTSALPAGEPLPAPEVAYELPESLREAPPRIGIYKSWGEPMTAGWTRWVFDVHGLAYDTVSAADVRAGGLGERYDVLLFQSQSSDRIVDGLPEEGPAGVRVPPAYAGGIGEEGRRALRAFVRGGGRIVAVERAVDLFTELLDLGVENAVERLPEEEFYVPGSILRLVLEEDPLTRGMAGETAGWYWRSSRSFRVVDPTVEVVARFGDGDPLLSGWLMGPEHLAGAPALVRAPVGRGSVVLFGFQPNYRGQSAATWPLLFNALAGAEIVR